MRTRERDVLVGGFPEGGDLALRFGGFAGGAPFGQRIDFQGLNLGAGGGVQGAGLGERGVLVAADPRPA
jgi:hypothetical protein